MSKEPTFYHTNRDVFRKPVTTKKGTTMGFRVLSIDRWVSNPEAIAEKVAGLLNKHWVDSND